MEFVIPNIVREDIRDYIEKDVNWVTIWKSKELGNETKLNINQSEHFWQLPFEMQVGVLIAYDRYKNKGHISQRAEHAIHLFICGKIDESITQFNQAFKLIEESIGNDT